MYRAWCATCQDYFDSSFYDHCPVCKAGELQSNNEALQEKVKSLQSALLEVREQYGKVQRKFWDAEASLARYDKAYCALVKKHHLDKLQTSWTLGDIADLTKESKDIILEGTGLRAL